MSLKIEIPFEMKKILNLIPIYVISYTFKHLITFERIFPSKQELVFNGIQWYSMVFNGIHWYSMVFNGIQWYSLVFNGIQCKWKYFIWKLHQKCVYLWLELTLRLEFMIQFYISSVFSQLFGNFLITEGFEWRKYKNWTIYLEYSS